ncbi:hypothetical protein DENSPDRAFT_872949 [Dentipellis sp. KUC8613]|nr:hypothetical protein DENSPDRAFT_872949 [Dentipellis sp. KUC8613]
MYVDNISVTAQPQTRPRDGEIADGANWEMRKRGRGGVGTAQGGVQKLGGCVEGKRAASARMRWPISTVEALRGGRGVRGRGRREDDDTYIRGRELGQWHDGARMRWREITSGTKIAGSERAGGSAWAQVSRAGGHRHSVKAKGASGVMAEMRRWRVRDEAWVRQGAGARTMYVARAAGARGRDKVGMQRGRGEPVT